MTGRLSRAWASTVVRRGRWVFSVSSGGLAFVRGACRTGWRREGHRRLRRCILLIYADQLLAKPARQELDSSGAGSFYDLGFTPWLITKRADPITSASVLRCRVGVALHPASPA